MIRGEKINLRLLRMDEVENYVELFNDLSQRGEFYSLNLLSVEKFKRDLMENNLWSQDHGYMVITDKSDRIFGLIAFFKGIFYMEGYEIGYNIFSDKDRGHGYGTEALKLFTSYLFQAKKIERLEVNLSKDNIGSKRVAEKSGYQYEGLQRKAAFLRGNFHDIEKYSILREECNY